MTITPQPGDVWERDGKRRVVDLVVGNPQSGFGYDVWWGGRKRPTWCTTWEDWARHAKLIERDGKAVTHG